MSGHVQSENSDSRTLDGVASLESVLYTEELRRRPSRPPNYEKENRALGMLGQALADSPGTILQTLADTILEVCEAGSAGISLLTTDDGGKSFYWPAIAGQWKAHIGGGTPRDFGPCGDVLDRDAPLLFGHLERRYTYFEPVKPPVEEALLVPFHVAGEAAGTIWAVAHDRHKFDAEDERMMVSLGKFASSAYQVVVSLGALKSQVAERTRAEEELRMSEERLRTAADGLENQVRVRTRELEQRNKEVLQQSEELRELSRRLRQSQDDERRRIARELHDSAGQTITALSLNLAGVEQRLKDKEVAKVIQESSELVHHLNKEIRTLSYLLHPPLLDENGLPSAIQWYLQGMTARSGLAFEVAVAEDLGRLPEEIELAVFRIVQECLTNVHRHSGSKTAAIRLMRDAESVLLEIQDEGKGMPSEKLTGSAQHVGVGITGMRERVQHLKGVMDFKSSSKGTKVSVSLPIPKTDTPQQRNTVTA